MPTSEVIPVGPLSKLTSSGPTVVRGKDHNIVVFVDKSTVYAVDNRCPHMGFPLSRGSVRDGILTCHWHEARFDLESGCTFDLWADDVLKFDAWVEEGDVFVSAVPTHLRDASYYQARLIQSIEQDVGLVQAKSLLALLGDKHGSLDRLLVPLMDFVSRNLNSMTEGMHRLGCVVNLYPRLKPGTAYQALLYATRQLARETVDSVPHRNKEALKGDNYSLDTLKLWLHQWVQTRHRDAAERTLLAGVHTLEQGDLADLTFSVASQRLYADGGHLLEACNKVFELTDVLGGEFAPKLFPLLVDSLTQSRGEEENTTWHHPVQIVRPLAWIDDELPSILASNKGTGKIDPALVTILCGDDPIAIIEALKQALIDDVAPAILAREVSYAAALRLARFATSNEVTDWFNPQHTFIHSNATCRAVERSPTPEVVRNIFQSAISVYVDRFLNVPAARLPSERNIAAHASTDPASLLQKLLAQLDHRGDIDDAANIVARYIDHGYSFDDLIDCLTLATVREDLDFHSLQVLDAATYQTSLWDDRSRIANIMVGVVRNLAAHCPTRRAGNQTALIAVKLQKGEPIYEAEAQ